MKLLDAALPIPEGLPRPPLQIEFTAEEAKKLACLAYYTGTISEAIRECSDYDCGRPQEHHILQFLYAMQGFFEEAGVPFTPPNEAFQ